MIFGADDSIDGRLRVGRALASPAGTPPVSFNLNNGSVSIGKLQIDGRVIKTATSETRASDNGYATDKHLALYAPMAKAETPLITARNIYTSRAGQSTPNQLGVDTDDKIALCPC